LRKELKPSPGLPLLTKIVVGSSIVGATTIIFLLVVIFFTRRRQKRITLQLDHELQEHEPESEYSQAPKDSEAISQDLAAPRSEADEYGKV
jgi:hypothetical protein